MSPVAQGPHPSMMGLQPTPPPEVIAAVRFALGRLEELSKGQDAFLQNPKVAVIREWLARQAGEDMDL